MAHKPPPAHGQSFMVERLLAALDESHPGEFVHVDCRFNEGVGSIGRFAWRKITRLFGYAAEALWARCHHGLDTVYYVPTLAGSLALFRDWMLLALLRMTYPRLVFHWHAVGLGEWAIGTSQSAVDSILREVTRTMLDGATSSLAISEYNRRDASHFYPQAIDVLPNGVEDPIPGRAEEVIRGRRQRRVERERNPLSPPPFTLLFCTTLIPGKGLYEALEGAAKAAQRLPGPVRFEVAGTFLNEEEERRFQKARREWMRSVENFESEVLGFIGGEEKTERFAYADGLLFPSYIDSQGLVALEAMAYGLPVVTTRWRGIPEVLPEGYPFVVPIKDADAVADAIFEMYSWDDYEGLRERFLADYDLSNFKRNAVAALERVERLPHACSKGI